MRKVAIVGGGQSGLQLALGLLQNPYEVIVVSNRTPEQILSGRVSSSQFMFHDSLQNERDLGINFWSVNVPSPRASRSPFPDRQYQRLSSPPDYSPYWFDQAQADKVIKQMVGTTA
jgi:cation diffusion facilitator CzcD-associated flavoprotein CzcO